MNPLLNIPVFAGQGTSAANTPHTRKQAMKDASTPSGSLILSACFEAFHIELSSLPHEEFLQTNIDLSDFRTKEALLELPAESYINNPIITGTTLLLMQSLRYVAFVESSGVANDSLTPFSDVLKGNLEHGLGILGFSSGILPACVVGTSLNAISYISHAVEAYRLAIWIGIRTQAYRAVALTESSDLPWSLVVIGVPKNDVEYIVEQFNESIENIALQVFLTAVTDDQCVTISGHPDVLASFINILPTGSIVHKTLVDTLYHCSAHIGGKREQILEDVTSRSINFPRYSEIAVPIRSTLDGGPLTKDSSGCLVEAVVDMILTQPVNWNMVVKELMKSIPSDKPVRILNIGPGTGLAKGMERALSRERVTSIDISSSGVQDELKPKKESIAIVGMAVHMPGARNQSELWSVLEKGINTISEIPEHRFKISDYKILKDPNSGRQMKAHTGNFIDGVDEFDNKFFKISPREARSMDPQQRILLQVSYEALENAGYVPNATPSFQTDTFGCYIGVATHDYIQNLRNDIDVYYSTGTLKAFLSGRISYAMQLSGPSIVVDTACSSSAVAIYQGCRALMNGDCNSAIVGGVNVISSPDMMLGLDRGHFLSPTGQCKAFDASADGYSRSEGCGIFVIKRLCDAIAENDNILGIIRGIEVNQSGLAHSITHPHAPTQASLFRRVLENAGVDAQRVNVVEAHGTGTQAGDPNELDSIRSIFSIKRSFDNPLHITSIKSNIGHLEAASGAAGLAKLLLMLQHRTIPRLISLKNLNPRIAPLEHDNTIIDTVATPWPSYKGKPRVALLNNFGAAGSNTATLLEEYDKPSHQLPSFVEGLSFPFGLSAKTDTALDEFRSRYIAWLQDPRNDIRLADIAYSMTARRMIYDHRLAVQASTREELVDKLQKASFVQIRDDPSQVIFVFSGQGGQYLGMGKSLYESVPLFRKCVDECHSILVAAGFPGVISIILAGDGGSGLSKMEEFEAYQAAIFSLEYALAKVWISWGVTPSAVVGHSLGEYAALVVASVLSTKAALLIIANRVRFMMQKCALNTTGMIAVNIGPEAVNESFQSSITFTDLSIACYNSATDCVVSGPIDQIKAFKSYLDSEIHCKNILLSVPFGYHSSAMEPLLQSLTEVAQKTSLQAPSIPVVSNVLGTVVMPGDASVFTAGYFARHCAEPVLFDKGISALVALPAFSKVDAWVEIGPHTTTLPMLRANANVPKDTLLLGSLKKQQTTWSTLSTTLSQLYLTNVPLLWREMFSHIPVSLVNLPSYPFARTKFWVAFKEKEDSAAPQSAIGASLVTDYRMLYSWVQYPSKVNGYVAIFETPISTLADSIQGHSVGGMPLCPASVYLEQVFAGIELSKLHVGSITPGSYAVLRKIEFAKPLVYEETVARTVITSISFNDGQGVFSVSSRIGGSDESIHVHGEYRLQLVTETASKFSRALPVISRQLAGVLEPRGGEFPEVFSTRTAYEVIFPRVVDYAKSYHTMQSLTVDPTGMEGCADVRLPRDYDRGKYVAHPVFMDTLLHVAGFVANMQGGVNDAYICSEVGTVKAIPELIDNNASYTVYCSNAWLEDEGVMLAEAYAIKTSGPRIIVAHIKGMHFRKVRLNSLKRSLALAAGKAHAPNATAVPKLRRNTVATKPVEEDPPQLAVQSIDISVKVIKIVAETCGIGFCKVHPKTDLESLGVDSLMSIEIFGKLQNVFRGTDLDAHKLSYCKTVADIVEEISKNLPQVLSASPSPAELPSSTINVDVQTEITRIISETCDVSAATLNGDTDLESLGVDSLMSIEISGKLEEAFPQANVNIQLLSTCRTIGDITRNIPPSFTSSPPAYPTSSSGASSPRTLVVNEEKLVEPSPLSVDTPDVKKILASVLGIDVKDILDDMDLESLGLDSLTSIEALSAFKTEFGMKFPEHLFSTHRTARSIHTYLSTRMHS